MINKKTFLILFFANIIPGLGQGIINSSSSFVISSGVYLYEGSSNGKFTNEVLRAIDNEGSKENQINNSSINIFQNINIHTIYLAEYVKEYEILPNTLQSFKAYCNNGSNIISWNADFEKNVDFFTIEKSTDGIHFYKVATMQNLDIGIHPISHHWIDSKITGAENYYRLKQTYKNGSEKLYTSVHLNCNINIPALIINNKRI